MPTDRPEDAAPSRLERAARAVDDARRTADSARRALMSPAGVRGVTVEAAWWVAHLAMWPFAHRDQRTDDVLHRTRVHDAPPVHRALLVGDVEAAGTPIILVHGIVDNRSVFTLLRRGLRRRGFGRVVTVNYSSINGDVRLLADRLGELVEQVCEETGYERVHVVGHSLGGLVARYYVQRLGGDARVHTLVTLGSPHSGTLPAYVLPHPLVRQLRPGSDVVTELAEPAPGCRTRFVAVWSDLDQMVVPQRSGRVVHPDLSARNVFVRGVGHMSLPVDGRVVHEICTTLAHLDHEGHTVAAGATSIASSTGRSAQAPPPAPAKTARGRSRG
ncbi:esterase/lipase family protein [Longivirga aurantiaca]|uniref:Esterase/lipase family protein n=1 Tax=Longivirga aurantiaca TaxID=1837743 RepID=A0ABW1SXL9_9ACTN